ncbi:large conductance mechanosensitive channel protein MscL [Columbia Basin potato purple top phytoplasma]|uniref:Large conductance mechanosensitive channel protein MscL n=1 Tax=Columbia Basin potato purple top phytoplasma TaxID=307134 RepID=A0ABT5L8Y6_9MOLU|nr:large conductance mechanosensitive channel protein MscL [Columbia Basin potato purple top phytoplasma]MDC9032003.1 large conductance mechanosensitive channel protein MscL [Columbia Basin potato purple top phytoplasma]
MQLKNIKKFQSGFKEFINKGDIIKLSIAFIMGQLFTKVISSLSTDIIMPPINLLLNRQYIKSWKLSLNNEITINYGNFLQNLFEFLLVSLVIYTFLSFFYQKIIKKNDSNEKQKLESLETEKIKVLKEIKELLEKK